MPMSMPFFEENLNATLLDLKYQDKNMRQRTQKQALYNNRNSWLLLLCINLSLFVSHFTQNRLHKLETYIMKLETYMVLEDEDVV